MPDPRFFIPFDPRLQPAPSGEPLRQLWRVHALLERSASGGKLPLNFALREFALAGSAAIPELRRAAADNSLPPHTRELASMGVRMAVCDEIGGSLAFALNHAPGELAPEVGAAVLARLLYPDLDPEAPIRKIDRMGKAAAKFVGQALGRPLDEQLLAERPLDVVLRLGEFWRTKRFAGKRDDFYDARNSMLPDVLERKSGLPITLSVVYLALARRLGLQAEGIGLPGHFIVRVTLKQEGREGVVYVDPFHHARPLDVPACKKLVESQGRRFVPGEHLRPVSTRDLLLRMCYNLLNLYDAKSESLQAEWVATVLLHLNAHHPSARMVRAERRLQRGEKPLGVADLYAVLSEGPGTPAAKEAAAWLRRLESRSPFEDLPNRKLLSPLEVTRYS